MYETEEEMKEEPQAAMFVEEGAESEEEERKSDQGDERGGLIPTGQKPDGKGNDDGYSMESLHEMSDLDQMFSKLNVAS